MWIHGSNTINSTGNFGTQGVPSATNEPPALYEPCEWTDLTGKFWLYGGEGSAGGNDLWCYDPATDEWTWMRGTNSGNDPGNYGTMGVASPTNQPPSKGGGISSWVDLNNNLWMFGGRGPAGNYSDLWKYDITSNEWTWMKDTINGPGIYGTQGISNPANYPPAREETAATWTDNSGDLWLFGGYTGPAYNDLWRFNIASNSWTWMKGANVTNQPGVYGTQGVEAPANTPSARWVYSRWKDNNGNFWLFGGGDYNFQYLNDLWRYNPVTNNWTWMSGSNIPFANSVFGTKCVTDSANLPGSRAENRAAWTDVNGNFWMFGGILTGSGLNDLWMYCVATNQWTWTGGDTIFNSPGSWGTKGVSNPSNRPSARDGAISWSDQNGHLYLFGGFGDYNDLWVFKIDSSCGTCPQSLPSAHFTCSDTAFCNETGECINFFDHSTGNPTSWQWSFQGASPSSSTLQNPDSICYTIPGTYTVQLIVSNGTNYDTLTVSPLIIFGTNPPPPTITVHGGDTLISSHGSTYQWYFNGAPLTGATDSFYVAHQGGTYAVQITDSMGGCYSISNGVTIIGIQELNSNRDVQIYPNPASQSVTISWPSSVLGNVEITITNVLGERVYSPPTAYMRLPAEIDVSALSKGVYILQLRDGDHFCRTKFIKN